tara:strand:+ start:16288 stop:16845 length:558 start_codon:yes stop_codon:yes gene_type:complete
MENLNPNSLYMAEQNILTQTGKFLYENGFAILFVAGLFAGLMVYIVVNNIEFKNQKVKLEKVLVVEKMTNPMTLTQLNQEASAQTNNNDTCKKLNNKSACTSLGTCVWAVAKDTTETIKKCVAAQALGSGSQDAAGSDGPSDLCFCSKNGKLLPWEEYYYLDGGDIKSKKGRVCSAKGQNCTYKN